MQGPTPSPASPGRASAARLPDSPTRGRSAKKRDEDFPTDVYAANLLRCLRVVPHHCIGLRRNKYRVVRRISNELSWTIVKDSDASIVWLDKWGMSDMCNLRHYKVGHFSGISELSTKCALGRTLNRMRAEFPAEYDFFPLSFELPRDRERLVEYAAQYAKAAAAARAKRKKGGSTLKVLKEGRTCVPGKEQQPQPQPNAGDRLAFICKPDASSQGRGIYLALGLDEIEELRRPGTAAAGSDDDSDSSDDESASPDAATAAPPKRRTMIQAYLPRPLTMDGRKFDLRIYVLVTSAFPTLRAYIYRQGLVRLATVQYEPPSASNSSKRRMFLTNYAVNKAANRAMDVRAAARAAAGSAATFASAAPAAAGAGAGGDGGEDEDGDGTVSDKSNADSSEEEVEAPGDATPGGSGSGAGDGGRPKTAASSGTRKGRVPQSKRYEPPMPPWTTQVNACHARDGCKWTIDTMLQTMAEQGIDTEVLWGKIKDVITKTLLAARPYLAHKYRNARPQLRKAEPPAAAAAVMRRAAAQQRSRSSRPAQSVTPSRAAGFERAVGAVLASPGGPAPRPAVLEAAPPPASTEERSPGGSRRAASAGRVADRYPPLARVVQTHPVQAASAGAAVFASLLATRPAPPLTSARGDGAPFDRLASAPAPDTLLAQVAQLSAPPAVPSVYVSAPVTVGTAAAAVASGAAAPRSRAAGVVLASGAAALSGMAHSGRQLADVSGGGFSLVGKAVSVKPLPAGPAMTTARQVISSSNGSGSARSVVSGEQPLSARAMSGGGSTARSSLLPPLSHHASHASTPATGASGGSRGPDKKSTSAHPSFGGGTLLTLKVVDIGPTGSGVVSSAPMVSVAATDTPMGSDEGDTSRLSCTSAVSARRADVTAASVPSAADLLPASGEVKKPRRRSTAAISIVDSMCSSTTAGSKPIVPPTHPPSAASVEPKTPERATSKSGSGFGGAATGGAARRVPPAASSSPQAGSGSSPRATATSGLPVFFPDDGEQGFRVRHESEHAVGRLPRKPHSCLLPRSISSAMSSWGLMSS